LSLIVPHSYLLELNLQKPEICFSFTLIYTVYNGYLNLQFSIISNILLKLHHVPGCILALLICVDECSLRLRFTHIEDIRTSGQIHYLVFWPFLQDPWSILLVCSDNKCSALHCPEPESLFSEDGHDVTCMVEWWVLTPNAYKSFLHYFCTKNNQYCGWKQYSGSPSSFLQYVILNCIWFDIVLRYIVVF